MVLSTLISSVRADTQVIHRENSSNFSYGGFYSGTHSEVFQTLPGILGVSCQGNSGESCIYFYAQDTFDEASSYRTVTLKAEFATGSVSSSVYAGAWGGVATAKVYVYLYDITGGTFVYSSQTAKDWTALGLVNGYSYPISNVYMVQGHNYEFGFGAIVKTGNGLFGDVSTATANGRVTLLEVTC